MKKILVVVDMQNDFIDGVLGTKQAQNIVPNVIQKIKKYMQDGETIYFTKDTHTTDYLNTQEGKRLPVEHCIRNTAGWELNPEIQKLADEIQKDSLQPIIFEKPSFGSEVLPTTIKNSVQENEKVAIEVIGLCTDICVISNVVLIKAFLPEATVQVDALCCAGVTPESHENAINAMKMIQVDIIN
ncbi:MAG: amidase [Epulopiscium sp. Nele67-Bin004]|nr:MAG: amidase [Epulopiscium sp. Nele67-Bin004]